MTWLQRTSNSAQPFEKELDAFAFEVDRLAPGDVLFLRAMWNDLDHVRLDAVRRDATAAIERSGRGDASKALEQGLVRWAAGSTRPFGTVSWIQEPGIAIELDARRQGMGVLRDIGYAVIARDVIPVETFDLLYEPWRVLHEDESDPPGS